MTIYEAAAVAGRDYITPEDVHDAYASGCSADAIRRDVLLVLGRVSGVGAEDAGLCAFVAATLDDVQEEP